MTTATGGIRLRHEFEYRYVGLTTKTARVRLRQHVKVASEGRKTPFYDWLRKQNASELAVDELDWIEGLDALGTAEIDWIAYLRLEGDRLLNLSEGGLGPTGVVWTDEMREAARIRSTGRKGLSRLGEAAPFYGKSHSAEQKKKWSRERRGQNAGQTNPNFGKFGLEHPSFGHVMPEESRRALSEQRTGAGNPNYGRTASAETKAKMSAVRKGVPMPSSRRSAHTRHHTNKGVTKDTCQYCIEDAAKLTMSEERDSHHE
ncbi:NUMOD3 domain-containing DNA-binding protein [Sinomonas sp. P10A9]|uniref:NUMOD3 domain-containing DNA-binding protein n=1 Tax=Sinomonas puerhi TaxID=3238584 RepID=A0AB39KYK2_9MICC